MIIWAGSSLHLWFRYLRAGKNRHNNFIMKKSISVLIFFLLVYSSLQAGNPGGPGPGGRGRGRGQGNWNMGPPGGLQEFNFIVPTGKTGLIIGKGNVF